MTLPLPLANRAGPAPAAATGPARVNRLIARTIAFVAALLVGGLCLAGWMGLSAIQGAHQTAMEGAIGVALDDIGRTVEAGARLGIAPAEQANLHAVIASESTGVPMLHRISVLDARGAVLASGPSIGPEPTAPGQLRRPVLDDLGEPIAVIAGHYDTAPIRRQTTALGRTLLGAGTLAALVLGLLAALLIRRGVAPIQRLVQAPEMALAASAPLAALDAALDRIESGLGSR